MKLYDNKVQPDLNRVITKKLSTAIEEISLEKEFDQLANNIKAYKSLSVVNNTIVLENFNFIDKKNYVIYNEYIKAITSNLDVKYIPVIAQETIELLPTVALNHNIALEGFLGDIWEKIKKIFTSLYEKIKKLFITYFTRLGRLEKRLTNIKEVLEELSDKEIGLKQGSIDKVPSSLGSKYPLSDTIGLAEVDKVYANAKTLYESYKTTLSISKEFANKDMLSKDFIEKLKILKEKSKELQDSKKTAESDKEKTWVFTKARKEANDKLKTIGSELKETDKEIESKESELNLVVGNDNSLAELTDDDKKFEVVKKEFDEYLNKISSVLEKVKGKELTGGKVITDIKISKEDVDIEIDTNSEKVTMITLSDKDNILKLVNDSIETLPELKKTIELSAEVNDTIYKQIDSVNKLIHDLDKVTDDVSGKYKTILQNKVKERLILLKEFFSLYNKLNKLTSDTLTESLEGNVDYSTLCLKYYG